MRDEGAPAPVAAPVTVTEEEEEKQVQTPAQAAVRIAAVKGDARLFEDDGGAEKEACESSSPSPVFEVS